MKNLANKNFWFVAIMGMVMGLTFVACSPDDDEYGAGFSYNEKNDTTHTPDPDTDWHVDWNTDMQLRFGYRMEEYTFDWPSDMVVHMTNYKNNTSKDTTYVHACPMSAQMQGPTLVWSDSLTTTKFNGITLLSEDATAWLPEDAKEQEKLNTFRWEVDMNSFKDTITSTLVEARIMLDGKYVNFKKGSKPNPSRRSAEPKMGNDTTINGKLYSQEIVDVVINCELHKSYPVKEVSYLTKVLREKSDEPVVTMPNPELKIKKILNIPNYTLSPEWMGNSSNDKVKAWHKVLPVLATAEDGKNYYFIWVDGSFVAQVAQGSENKIFNSAYFAEGSWRPASLEPETNGWRYVFVVNGTGKMKSVDQNMTLCEDIKNFAKSKDAAQTPSIYTEVENTEYSGRVYAKVKGFNIDMKSVIETTIGEVY